MANMNDLDWSVGQFQESERLRKYSLYWNYYEGNQRLAFATEKFKESFGNLFREFAENACPAVVDSLVDRLKLIGFRSNKATQQEVQIPSLVPGSPPRKRIAVSDPTGQAAWDIWTKNYMDLRSKDVHREASMMGDSYVIVWPGDEDYPEIWPQLANEMSVQYNPNKQGEIHRACKRWFDPIAAVWRLNVFTSDGICKYESKKTTHGFPSQAADFILTDEITNPYSRIPVFHFARGTEHRFGRSDLKDVVPIQDALNKSVMDMLIAMEFASFKQRYIIGMEVDVDEETGQPRDATMRNYGADRMMAIPNEDAKVGQFDATDLGQFLRVQEKFWASIARVSGTPLHYFFITQGDFPSGEAQKAAEARFSTRIEDSQVGFGNVWESVMEFALELSGEQYDEELEFSSIWSNATPRSEAELADTAIKKKSIGFSRSYLLKEFGLSDKEVDEMLAETDAEAMQKVSLDLMSNPQAGPQQNQGNEETGNTVQSRNQPTGENTRGVRQ